MMIPCQLSIITRLSVVICLLVEISLWNDAALIKAFTVVPSARRPSLSPTIAAGSNRIAATTKITTMAWTTNQPSSKTSKYYYRDYRSFSSLVSATNTNNNNEDNSTNNNSNNNSSNNEEYLSKNTSNYDNVREEGKGGREEGKQIWDEQSTKLLDPVAPNTHNMNHSNKEKKKVVIIGSGWSGLSAAHHLYKSQSSASNRHNLSITVIDAAPRVGGLVRDGYKSLKGTFQGEAGQHGFWDNYHNIFQLLYHDLGLDVDNDILTGYDVQGQYSPRGLEAIWPVYRRKMPLPTGLAQALYTRFERLSIADRLTAFPLVLAFSEFDNSKEMWEKYDRISFRDLCVKLGVSRRCYEEAFEPMILTGLFAPGEECSAAAALGMAYFFVLKSQNSFDVRWCRGNIGEKIFEPWVASMKKKKNKKNRSGEEEAGGVDFLMSTRVVGFRESNDGNDSKQLSTVICQNAISGESFEIEADTVVFAVGGAALNAMVQRCPVLAQYEEFRRFANLRGTGILATRLYLDRFVDIPYSANACWGFDKGVGQTFFDISKLHGIHPGGTGTNNSIVEVDYYHAASLLVMDDESIVKKAKKDLDVMLGRTCQQAKVLDAAIVRLPNAVNWYSPGSYANMPDIRSKSIPNVYFVGDIVKTQHGSWSQEKAYVTGIEAANLILGKPMDANIIPLSPDEIHVAAGRQFVSLSKSILGLGDRTRAPSLVDFLW